MEEVGGREGSVRGRAVSEGGQCQREGSVRGRAVSVDRAAAMVGCGVGSSSRGGGISSVSQQQVGVEAAAVED